MIFGVGAVLGQDRPQPALSSWYWLSPSGAAHVLALVLGVVLFTAPMWPRVSNSYSHVISGSYSIYGQQYQMARFVRRYYSGKGVIANDVCAISYLGEDVNLLDFAGLSDIEALRLRRSGQMDQESMRRLSKEHGCRVAILYDDWAKAIFNGPLPVWVKVCTWTIPYNTVCAGDTVSFYANSKEYEPELQYALRQFAGELPKDIRQEGLFLGPDSLEPVGVYTPYGGGKEAMHFWTVSEAGFDVYPADSKQVGVPDMDLSLAICTLSQNQTIDVYFNGEHVLTKELTAAESQLWITFSAKVKWLPGRNLVKLVGHGVPTLRPGDHRPTLFAVLDPRRMRNEDGSVVPQPGVAQAKD